MQFIKSSSLAPGTSNWLANSRHPRILHVFDHACNLINERREVLSIVTPQIGNGPFNLVLEEDICFSEHLGLESEVSTSPTQLHLGDLTVPLANAKLWNPHPNWVELHTRRGDIAAQIIQLPTLAPWVSAGVTNSLGNGGFDSLRINHQGLPMPQSLISRFSAALSKADVASAKTITSELAGLGIGLTPSGDDLIMGAIYATWIIHPPELALTLAEEMANTAAPLTTSLSAAWLRSAGRGEAGILWHEFFDALVSKDHIRIEESEKKILAVGETSGADALAGFIDLIIEWEQHCSNL
jgi:Protein of unknown function (DUF2877)